MFIVYENADGDIKLISLPQDDIEDVVFEHLPDHPWENYIEVADDHAVVLDPTGHIEVGDWADANTIKRVASEEDLAALRVRVGEFRDFMKFFTQQEQLAIVSATLENPQIKLWYDTAMGGANFSLDHPSTALGLNALVQNGLLAQERATEILQTGDFAAI